MHDITPSTRIYPTTTQTTHSVTRQLLILTILLLILIVILTILILILIRLLIRLQEVAITACDLAEVIGSAVALKLLFGCPLIAGVWVTALDVLILLFTAGSGFRVIEGRTYPSVISLFWGILS